MVTVNLASSLQLSGEIKASSLIFDVKQSDGKALPTWIEFDSTALTFKIQVTDKTVVGDFFVTVAITSALHPGWSCRIDSW